MDDSDTKDRQVFYETPANAERKKRGMKVGCEPFQILRGEEVVGGGFICRAFYAASSGEGQDG